ncbi:MAG: hypothetical protein IKN12_11270 [Selenomonadaceae bacterium]|nr:hypothetical protein [Selenomonadaceae bacterium]
MLAIYLQPDSVKIVQAKLRKDNILDVQDYLNAEESSELSNDKKYLDMLLNFSEGTYKEDVEAFAELFREIKKIPKYKRENIYIVLPDFMFYMVDCFTYDKDMDMEPQIRSFVNIDLDQIYYSMPILTNPAPQENCATIYAIERKYIDFIISAAEVARVRLASVEAASISFLRASGIFQKEEFIFQGFEKHATMIAYSSIAGLFAMDVPELALENLGYLPERDHAEALIKASIIQFENTAEQTFTNINDDIPITLLANPILIESFNAFKEREGKRQHFAPFILSEIPENEQQDWMPVVGTLLQSIEFPNLSYGDSVVIDDYERVLSGNILPDDIQKSSKTYQLLSKIKRTSFIGSVAMGVVFLAELIGIFALSTVEIPPSLEQEYQEAQENSKQLDTELQVFELAAKEHQYPLQGIKAVIDNRPKDIGFLSVQVGGDGKNVDANWVRLKVVAQDPLLFQSYLSALQNDERFGNVVISEIDANDSAGIKTANITLAKGKVTE